MRIMIDPDRIAIPTIAARSHQCMIRMHLFSWYAHTARQE